MRQIQTITNTTAGEFDFDSIPDNYTRLWVKGVLRSSAADTSDTVFGIVNASETSSQYHSQRFSVINGGSVSSIEYAEPRVGISSGASSPANYYFSVCFCVEEYTGSQRKTIGGQCHGARTATQLDVLFYTCLTPVTDRVYRLRFRTNNHPTDGLIGTLRLYGEY